MTFGGNYELAIAELEKTMAGSSMRMSGLFGNLNRALSVLVEARPLGLSPQERGAVLAFEALLLESLNRNASLLHALGEEDDARRALDLAERLKAAADYATMR